jgi:very-short-patch-repair endonuclease
VPVGGYILDFYSNELRLSVELDGSQHYDAGPNEAYDADRARTLEAMGVTIVCYANREFVQDERACLRGLAAIASEIAARGPHPSPLPAYRERGPELASPAATPERAN